MKIYTRKGDGGETSLLGGTRVPKHDLRIEAYGTVDELNAHLGLLSDQPELIEQVSLIREIQNQLFVAGSHLANDAEHSHFKLPELSAVLVPLLEKSIDQMNDQLPLLKNFVLPGGHPAHSMVHIARCVCRRAERRVVELQSHTAVDPHIITLLNRLSDWLFVLSRYVSHQTQSPEVLWTP
ncbi:MAG: cob(I)yrinic acid a,c-diamide adenosyltransferase [Bacteroidia bacterium]